MRFLILQTHAKGINCLKNDTSLYSLARATYLYTMPITQTDLNKFHTNPRHNLLLHRYMLSKLSAGRINVFVSEAV